MTKKETAKQRIIDASRELFSEVGYESTSVREIAKKAGVNLASINYYFKSKKNLLAEIFLLNFETFAQSVGVMYQSKDDWSIEDFALGIFELLSQKSDEFYSAFRIFLNDGVTIPEHLDGASPGYIGPPGGKFFTKVIDSKYGAEIPIWKKEWLMRTLYNNVVWEFVMLQTSYAKSVKPGLLNDDESKKRIKNVCMCLTKGVSDEKGELHEVHL